MKNIQAFTFLFYVTVAYGATIGSKEPIPQFIDLLTSNMTTSEPKLDVNSISKEETNENSVALGEFSVTNPENSFAIGKIIAELGKNLLEMISKMDISEQGIRNLIQLIVPLVSLYLGPYSQVIVPMLSGIATVLFKSLAR